jgi:hypothetical protein
MKISLGRKWKLSLTKESSAQVIPNNDVPLFLQMKRLPESFVSKKFQPNKNESNSVTAIEFVKTLAVNGHERKGSYLQMRAIILHIGFYKTSQTLDIHVSPPLFSLLHFLQSEFFSSFTRRPILSLFKIPQNLAFFLFFFFSFQVEIVSKRIV